MPTSREHLATICERRRLDLHLTRQTLADRAGVAPKTIRDIEERRRTPEDQTLFKLAPVLGTSASELRADLAGQPA